MKLKADFQGTGTMRQFVEESNKLFEAVNNIEVITPPNYSGVPPTAYIAEGKVVFDFGEALIFTLNNVQWDIYGTALNAPATVTVLNSVEVVSGKLRITVQINKVT